jgi:hypothetical protein
MNINSNYQARWTHLSAEQARRMKDREEWARQQEVQHQERMKAIREQNRVVREEMRAKAQEAVDYASMVQEMLQELCDQNPEWEERKEQVQRVSLILTVVIYLPQNPTSCIHSERRKGPRQNHPMYLCQSDTESTPIELFL